MRAPQFRIDVPNALGFVAGVCASAWQPSLPSPLLALAMAATSLALAIRWPGLRVAAMAAIGWAWASVVAAGALGIRVADALTDRDIAVSGIVVGLPRMDLQPPRFELMPDAGTRAAGIRGRLRLSWYGEVPELQPGQSFEGTVRLRAPRGVKNPGGFDFARFAIEQRLVATGYVRRGAIDAGAPLSRHGRIDRWRAHIAARIVAAVEDRAASALLRALAVGDQRGLGEIEWEVLRVTGTGHLIAISGMHIGLVAAFGALLFGALQRLWPPLALHVPRLTIGAAGALLFAVAYALLAGWSLPVQRTLLMIVIVLAARLLRRQASMAQSLALAAVLVLLWDPLAVLGAGFWLSFIGVAGLMWALPEAVGVDLDRRLRVLQFGRAQMAMSLGLLPITIAFFGQGSAIGPIANVVAVPWITVLIVPLLLVAVALMPIVPAAADGVLAVTAWLLRPLWTLLESMSGWPGAAWFFAEAAPWALALAVVGALWWLLPRGAPLRWFGLLLFAPMLLPRNEAIADGDARIDMIDVGQGLSVLVRTQSHALLFDAGLRSRSGFDMGEAVVVPTLHALGVRRLDRLVLSNLDADHAGGRAAVLRAFPEAQVAVGIDSDPAARCEDGVSWQWDGVRFAFLHPPRHFPDEGNDSSCVLRVETRDAAALLTGDIEEAAETRLLRTARAGLRADVVLVPHHGSRTSSTPAFVAATGADLALNSAGADNHYGHPHPEVRARWQAAGARWFDTASGGFTSIRMSNLDDVDQHRVRRPRYWH